ncbi:hypothetical protein ACKAV7_012963 [Fusarium commune]
MVPASAVTAESTKRICLPNYAGNSSSISRPRSRRLGSSARHAVDGSGTTAPRRDKGSPVSLDTGLFVADVPDASGARLSQPLSRKTLSSRQDLNADAHSSLPSSFLPDSTSRAISSAVTAGLLMQYTLPSSEAPDDQDLVDLPKTLSRYKKKLKKFISQWHASLTSGEEGDSGTESHHVPQTDDEPVVIRLGAATLVEALRAKSRLKNHPEEGDKAFDTLAIARRLQERDFSSRLSLQEICVIGTAVLYKVFGGQGQKRLADALTHLYGRHLRRYLAELDQKAGRVADEIRKGGPVTLSSFTLR